MKIPPGPGGVRQAWEKLPDVIAQFKLNGTRNMFYIFPDGRVECWGRDREKQKLYTLTPKMAEQIRSLGLTAGKFHVIDGELLHSKTKTVKDVSYVFDILVHDGVYLLGLTYRERYEILHRLIKGRYFPQDFSPKEGEMYLAENHPVEKWGWMWEMALRVDYCEGIFMKRLDVTSSLEVGYQVLNNSGAMCRVRKPHKNYRY
jgi:hypothetical protein